MSILKPEGARSAGPEVSYKTTRRSLVAAAAVLAGMVAGRTAHAMSRRPSGGHNCFLRGTRILTPRGEVEVEQLATGDLVSTVDGSAKPIKAIGHWSCPRSSAGTWADDELPIKVARSALAPLVPHTDLFLSTFHALYLDGLLVPVGNLVNGRSIVQWTPADIDTIEYFHVELDQHDVIFSEGAAAETKMAGTAHDAAGLPTADLFAPRLQWKRGAVIRSRLRSAVSPWIDRRHPGDMLWDRLADRAEMQDAA